MLHKKSCDRFFIRVKAQQRFQFRKKEKTNKKNSKSKTPLKSNLLFSACEIEMQISNREKCWSRVRLFYFCFESENEGGSELMLASCVNLRLPNES